jgi:hypothetical protein
MSGHSTLKRSATTRAAGLAANGQTGVAGPFSAFRRPNPAQAGLAIRKHSQRSAAVVARDVGLVAGACPAPDGNTPRLVKKMSFRLRVRYEPNVVVFPSCRRHEAEIGLLGGQPIASAFGWDAVILDLGLRLPGPSRVDESTWQMRLEPGAA